MLRVVVDPGVLIAALLSSRGAPATLLLAWLEGRLHLIVSPGLLSELERVLLRSKFRPYVTKDEVAAYVDLIRNFAVLLADPEPQPGLSPDPGDDDLIALARASGADFIVSGDPHLTGLRRARPPVVTPRAFVGRLGEPS